MITANKLRELFSTNREERIQNLEKAEKLNELLEESIRKRTPIYEDEHGILRAGRDFEPPYICLVYYSKDYKFGVTRRESLGLIHIYMSNLDMMKRLCADLNEKCRELRSEDGSYGYIPDFKETAKVLLHTVDHFDKLARLHGKENEQWFLNWQDALNEISVR